jgi:hypothetical protein
MNSKFINNNYAEEYLLLINSAVARIIDSNVYYENHHIIPKSLGGGNESDNLVNLTPREHFRAHQLLTEITTGKDKSSMIYAFWTMANVCNQHQKNRYIPTPEEYEETVLKRRALETSIETRLKIGKSRKGKVAVYNPTLDKLKYIDSDELEFYLSIGFEDRGKPKTETHKQNISATNKRKGIVPSSIGWNTGLTKHTSAKVAQAAEHMRGRVAWNKDKKNTGFGDPDQINPMKDPAKIKKMLETRANNKKLNDNN